MEFLIQGMEVGIATQCSGVYTGGGCACYSGGSLCAGTACLQVIAIPPVCPWNSCFGLTEIDPPMR